MSNDLDLKLKAHSLSVKIKLLQEKSKHKEARIKNVGNKLTKYKPLIPVLNKIYNNIKAPLVATLKTTLAESGYSIQTQQKLLHACETDFAARINAALKEITEEIETRAELLQYKDVK